MRQYITRISLLILLLILSQSLLGQTGDQKALKEADRSRNFSSDIVLTEQEQKASLELQKLKADFLKANGGDRFFKKSFFQSKQALEESPLYQAMTKMPKGGILHLHTEGTASASWVIHTAIQNPSCYIYWKDDNGEFLKGQLAFFKEGKAPIGFRKVAELNKEKKDFQKTLLHLLTFDESTGADSVQVWKEFERRFRRVRQFASYQPLFKAYYLQSFQELVKDNIQYAEIRAIISPALYDLNHSQASNYFSTDSIIRYFKEVQEQIKGTDPAFRFRLNYTFIRALDEKLVGAEFLNAFKYQKKYPEIMSGFDLVGEEDRGHSTAFFHAVWQKKDSLEKAYGIQMSYVFHDGESNSPGDENLYDAVALGSRRVGHAFNLYLFPALYDAVKKNNTALEICPLSSQILHFNHDLRSHPACSYLRMGIPCVLSSDDPAVFGYAGLSYDYCSATLAWNLSLADLKKLAMNSITYSLMTEPEKQAARKEWENRWNTFLAEIGKP
jgi:adenosine deaminase CECR1